MRECPHGEWPSPLAAERVGGGTLRLEQPLFADGAVYWVEGRPGEGGRCALLRAVPGAEPEELVPAPFSVKNRALETGGGACAVQGERLWFTNDADRCIYQRDGAGAIRRLTPEAADRYADLQYDARRERLIVVREDHAAPGEPALSLASIAAGTGARLTLHEGYDFYSSPRLSPDGRQLAWLAWRHPDMPWDATELWLADFGSDGGLQNPRRVAGGPGESVLQPEFSPDGVLHFVSDRAGGWWNIHRLEAGRVRPVTRERAEFAMPRWAFGMRHYGFLADGSLLAAFTRDGLWQLARVARDGRLQRIELPFTSIEHLHVGPGGAALLGGAADRPLTVARLDAGGRFAPLRQAAALDLPPRALSRPEPLSFPTAGGETAHALYYPPASADYRGPAGGRPPLLVKCHGGPTGATSSTLDLKIQFWTSRGFAVLDVNYRGSTGYGRAYREKLYGQWGIADVEDCLAGARHLAERGLADPARLLISGSSAGGFTVLAALTFHELFAAGASYYGIGDLEACMRDTHKFESRYGDRLIGPLPEARATYRARSPLLHAERLRRPVIFFQGTEDRVVPPAQSETMHAALRDNGVTTALLLFEGEAHGFRSAASIARALNAELAFYGAVLGFRPAGDPPLPPLDNPPE